MKIIEGIFSFGSLAQRNLVLIVRGGILPAVLLGTAFADLTESDFPGENVDLAEVRGWAVQRPDGGTWLATPGAVDYISEGGSDNGIVWKGGYGGKDQVRVVKSFPATTSDTIMIRFKIRPGTENLGGRLYFGRNASENLFALQFQSGRLWVLEGDNKTETDTGIEFQPDQLNQIQVNVTLSTAKAEVFVNGASAGTYDLLKDQAAISIINFFAGGLDHSSTISDLSITSVSDFSAQ